MGHRVYIPPVMPVGTMSKEQRKIFIQLDEIDFQLRKQWDEDIVNVNQRIRLFYGEEYGIQIRSRKQMGTEVEIILPVKMQSENMKKLGEEVEEDVSGVDRR